MVDISFDPGHVGPFGYKRAAAAGIADIAVGEGYQWAGGCYDNDDRDGPEWNFTAQGPGTVSPGGGHVKVYLDDLAYTARPPGERNPAH